VSGVTVSDTPAPASAEITGESAPVAQQGGETTEVLCVASDCRRRKGLPGVRADLLFTAGRLPVLERHERNRGAWF